MIINRNRGSAKMSELTSEQYEQLPDFVKEDYQEVDGVYKHAGVLKMKSTLNDLDSKLKAKDQEFNSLNERLTTFEKSKAEEIEKARADALEQAKTKGDVAEIEKRYQEQMTDLEKRTEQRVREQMSNEFALSNAKAKADAELSDIVSKLKPLDDDSAEALKIIVKSRQKVSEDAKILYSNADGSASVMDMNELVKELSAKPSVQRLIQNTITTNGGGLAKGSNGQQQSGSATNKAAEDAKAKGDLAGFLKASLNNRG